MQMKKELWNYEIMELWNSGITHFIAAERESFPYLINHNCHNCSQITNEPVVKPNCLSHAKYAKFAKQP